MGVTAPLFSKIVGLRILTFWNWMITSTSRGVFSTFVTVSLATTISSFPSTVTRIAVPAVPAAARVVPVSVRSGEPTTRIGQHRIIASGMSYSRK